MLLAVDELRQLSKRAFGRTHLLEVAVAIRARNDDSLVFDDLYAAVVTAAKDAGVEVPSTSAVRSDLNRLRLLGALDRLPRVRGELIRHEVRRKKAAFWQLLRELVPESETADRG
jgi:hypothetical protein